ncbi:MAG TPA: LemA family protein [Steroidobacteraceae bacterium]|nr:LemA family protein [Steroidobacteraceae bacterium]
MPALLIPCFLLILAVGYVITLYNGLVRVRNEVRLAWANIDVLLVQRHDELPKLVAVCQGYMQHERDTLERVVKARSDVEGARAARNVTSVSVAENALRTGLAGLYAVAENYPDLKANDLFRNLQTRISALETAIADRREIYNDAANAQNVRIETFPDALIARAGNFPAVPLLKFANEQTADVDLKPAFGR